MKIYTKTGDDGTTGLFGGSRVRKDDLRVEAYGTVDELDAVVGVAAASQPPKSITAQLVTIQGDLFVIGAELACTPGKEDKLRVSPIGTVEIERLEGWIDESEAELPALKSFVLPGGTPASAALHHGRTVCRRAERCVLRLSAESPVREDILIYLNRLSDLLFSYARLANHTAGVSDIPWPPQS